MFLFFFKQKTAYEMRISDWSPDVCSSDLSSKVPTTARTIFLRNRLALIWNVSPSVVSIHSARARVHNVVPEPAWLLQKEAKSVICRRNTAPLFICSRSKSFRVLQLRWCRKGSFVKCIRDRKIVV